MRRIAIAILGSVVAAVIGFSALSGGEAAGVAEAPPHGGLTPLAPEAAEDSFDPSQVQLEPGDPSPEDYVWDGDGNLVLSPEARP